MLTVLVACAGCSQDMWDGSRLKPLQGSPVFADGRASRPLERDTVARGSLTAARLTPIIGPGGVETDTLPFPLTAGLLDRGEQKYNEYCVACHGYVGYGDGIVPKRGYPPPPSYHTDRLRGAPLGHFYDVISNGYGVMYPYNDRVAPADRWAIAVYIRALQRSQNASVGDLPTGLSPASLGVGPVPSAPKQEPASPNIPDVGLTGTPLNGAMQEARP